MAATKTAGYILSAGILCWLVYAEYLPAQTPPKTVQGGNGAGQLYTIYDPAIVARGKSAFSAQCGFCHGASAKGGESGPSLLRSVVVLDDKDGELIGPVVLNGRVDRGMPKFSMTPPQIADIAAFLHEGVRAAAQRRTYQVLNIVTGNAKAGQAYFNGTGKCSTCHSVAGDLKGIGSRFEPLELQGQFLMPVPAGAVRSASEKNPVIVTVTLPSGQVVSGRLERMDDFNVVLTEANGDYRSFNRNGNIPRVVVRDPAQAHFDMLPRYTDADMHNLTAYLVTLK